MVDRTRRAGPPGLRIVLAYDLSPSAELAAALTGGTSWPHGTVIGVVTCPTGIGLGLSTFARLSEVRAHARQVRGAIEIAQQRVATELGAAGVTVETRIVHGRPERALIAEAERSGADLLVVGSRSLGRIAATMLGSVSKALVERASCSVLIARAPSVSRVLLATDGSAAAALATTLVATWPLFAGLPARVVGVEGRPPVGAAGLLADRGSSAASPNPSHESTAGVNAAVEAAVAELASRPRTVEREIRQGEPATEIVSAARAWGADVVAIGANGEPFLRRLVLGSVARNVLEGVQASVLVTRPRRLLSE